MRERSLATPRSGTDITTFGEERGLEQLQIRAPNSRWAVAQALATTTPLSASSTY